MKKVNRYLIFVFMLILCAVSVNAFSVVYQGTCAPNATDINVYNASGVNIFSETHVDNTAGCWDIGFYTIELSSTLQIQPNTLIDFYLDGMFAGNDTFNYSQDTNVTLNLGDLVPPVIMLRAPANGANVPEGPVLLTYNVTDHTGVAGCTLFINGTTNQTDVSVAMFVEQNFSVSLAQGQYRWQLQCTDSSPNSNVGLSDEWFFTVTGPLDYGILVPNLINPVTDIFVAQNNFFNFTTNVSCYNGTCCNVIAGLDPLMEEEKTFWEMLVDFFKAGLNGITGLAAGSLVSTTINDTPFYTLSFNPQNCGLLNENDTCTNVWWVNPTGALGTYEFFVQYNSSCSPNVSNVETLHINITITNNTAPSIMGVNVTNETFGDIAYTENTLVCVPYGYSDPEASPPVFYYSWYNNSELIAGATNFTFDCSSYAGCVKGTNMTCVVIPSDGALNGTPKNDTILILNSPPVLTIPIVYIEQDSYNDDIDLDDYVFDADYDVITWSNTNGPNVTAVINSTTNQVNFTPDAGFVGINYLNFTADDGDTTTTQTVMVIVIPAGGINVVNLYQIPSLLYRTNSFNIYCDGTDPGEDLFMPDIDFRIKYGPSTSSWIPVNSTYNGSTWVAKIQTNTSDFWLGKYDFRCRFNYTIGISSYVIDNGTVEVQNNEPLISVFDVPSVNRTQNLTANCTPYDVEDANYILDVDIKYQKPTPGWLDCAETMQGNTWMCIVPTTVSDSELGTWTFRCTVIDTDGGSTTLLTTANVSNNPPFIDLPQNYTAVTMNSTFVLNLSNYAYDIEDAFSLLTFNMTQSNISVAQCWISVNKTLECNYTQKGKSNLTITVYDTDGGMANDTMELIVPFDVPLIVNATFNSFTDFYIGDTLNCTFTVINPNNSKPIVVDSFIFDENVTHIYYSGDLTDNCTGANWSTGKVCTHIVTNVSGFKGPWFCDFYVENSFNLWFWGIVDNSTMLNTPPTLAFIPNKSVVAGDTLTFTITATDPNIEDVLTFSKTPVFGTLNPSSGLFTWTPSALDVGNKTFNFSVSDGSASDWQLVTITVYPDYCSNVSTLYYGTCSCGDGDINVYSNESVLVASESYGIGSGCYNGTYDILVEGGPEYGCDVRPGSNVYFTQAGSAAGMDFWNYSTATVVNLNLTICPPVCGNGKVDPGEECDGTNWGPITTCSNFDTFIGGALSCGPDCKFNTTLCIGPGNQTCGNNVVEVNETCDNTDWGPITGCSNFDLFQTGTLSCGPDCHFNTSNCSIAPPTCGDGVIQPGENCDGVNWGPITGCTDFNGYLGGILQCNDCLFDTTLCFGGTVGFCGDGVINGIDEECDGSSWGPIAGCSNFDGFNTGTLSCDANCNFDTSSCAVAGKKKGGGGGGGCVLYQEGDCGEWSKCNLIGRQYRECLPKNYCDDPAIVQKCPPFITTRISCDDGDLNQDESDVDCGGVCGPTCLDGQTCNSDNDCVSLSCENRICVSCRDGKFNQGEEDVDCGGPCTACPEEEIPAPPGCVDKFSSWHILLLLILLVLVGYGADKGYEFYLKKKNKPMPKWLTYIKEEQWVSYTAMAVLAIISILSLIFDNACFEDCLPFKSKYLLLIVNIILITLLIVRVYRLEKGLKPLQLYNKDWKKWLTAFIAVSVLIAGFYLHRFFTKSCLLQYPYYRVHPLMWFLPLFILSVLFLAYLAYKLVKEYSPGLFHAPKFRPEPALKPAPIIMPKPAAAVKPVKPKIMPKPKPLPKAKPVITPVPKPKPAIMPKIRKIIGPSAPVFADLDGMSPALQKVKAQVEGMFVEAYEALDENRLEDAQKIASSISKKYKTLPKELRDDIYSEIMILYNKIEKAI